MLRILTAAVLTALLGLACTAAPTATPTLAPTLAPASTPTPAPTPTPTPTPAPVPLDQIGQVAFDAMTLLSEGGASQIAPEAVEALCAVAADEYAPGLTIDHITARSGAVSLVEYFCAIMEEREATGTEG